MGKQFSFRFAAWAVLILASAISCFSTASAHSVVVEKSALTQSVLTANPSAFSVDYENFTWLEADSSMLSLLDRLNITYRQENREQIRFLHWQFDPLAYRPEESLVAAPRTASDHGLAFIQFRAPVKAEWLTELNRQQIKVLQYYPHHTYLVWSTAQALNQSRQFSMVRWADDFSPAFKISPELKTFGSQINQLHVHFYNDGDPQSVLDQLAQMGASVINHFPAQPDQQLYEAILIAPKSQLTAISQIPAVIWMGYASPKPVLDDESSAQTIAGNLLPSSQPEGNYPGWLSGVDLDGSGVVWSITDTGIDYSHPDLNSRIIGGFNYPGCNQTDPGNDPNSGGHGTHVAGILGGDGGAGFTDADGYLYGLGVAPGVSLFAQNPICGTQNSWPPAGGWQELTKNPILAGAVGSNNSWTSGEGTAHGYQASERTHDIIVRDGNFDTLGIAEQFMIVFSAGNSGPGASTLTAPKEAKNVVVTGGTQTWRFGNDTDAMYNSSSRGPAVDGRILPTIVAPGQQVSSTRNDGASQCASAISGTNGLYSFCTGTSMASPHAAGALVLLTEWWRNQNAGANPSPAMGKALLINSATDISGAAAIPNDDEGWGRINLSNIFESSTPFVFIDQEQLLTNTGEQWTATVAVANPNLPLKVTLVWSDAPGAIGANPALVNDLNLSVSTSGSTYLGNVFNSGESVPGGVPDTINNIENVFISTPGGSAEIRIDAFNIAGDGVPYNASSIDQDFALVCSNCVLQPDFTLDLPQTPAAACAPDSANTTIDVDAVLGFNDPVSLSVLNTPVGLTTSFDQNSVTPPAQVALSYDNTGSVTPGSYAMTLQATSTTGVKSRNLQLDIFDQVPASSQLNMPINGASNQSLNLSLSWSAVAQAGSYQIEIDDNADFSSPEINIVTSDTQLDIDSGLSSSTQYYWRVTVENACGQSQSNIFSFTTEALPGDCAIGTQAYMPFFDDMESGSNGWTHEGVQDTWQLSGTNVWSGSNAWYAEDLASVSDQQLITPSISLPQGDLPLTMQFYHHQTMERRNSAICWDAGLLEISSNAGLNWTQVPENMILTDAYNGTVDQGGNPIAGLRAWCGDPQDWTRVVVDLSSWQGQDVQFRFRLGSDGSVGRVDGWKIDDVSVQACPTVDLILADGFENNIP